MKNFLFLGIIISAFFLQGQQINDVDFKTAKVDVVVNPILKQVSGTVIYEFDVLKKTDSIFIDAQKMNFLSVRLDNKKVKFKNTDSKLIIYKKLKPNTKHELIISYKTSPKKSVYFIGWEYNSAKKQVWTQGQGKYTSNWLPSFDDTNEKVEFDLNITFDKNYGVIANGKLTNVEEIDNLKTWHYDMQKPMSSYLLAFAIGKYNKKIEYSKSGIPIEMYYYPEDSLKFEPTYRHTKQIFDFFEKEIGVAYPWQNYKQIPVKDFMYSGMENTSATIFSDSYVIDSIAFVDNNYVNVNAHELAHQWFGDLVTAKNGTHHWLQEGFATYYALLAEKEIFGDDYYYLKLFESSSQLITLSEDGKGEVLTDPKASSLTFYEKGAWALVILRELVGDWVFERSVKEYLKAYQYKNVTTNDFISIVEKEYGENLDAYVNLWLKSEKMSEDEIESFFIKRIHENSFLLKVAEVNFDIHRVNVDSLLSSNVFYFAKQKVFEALRGKEPNKYLINTYKNGFKTQEIETRQAISESLDSIPLELKQDFESLLDDKSYLTIEYALYKLWSNFPEDRAKYFEKTKDIIGFNDKSLRILWLTLVLKTPNYDEINDDIYYHELSGYTSPIYHFEVRQNAFQYLVISQELSDQSLKDLVNACRHHSWRFAKFSRNLLDSLIKDDNYKKRFVVLIDELNDDEANYLSKKLEIK